MKKYILFTVLAFGFTSFLFAQSNDKVLEMTKSNLDEVFAADKIVYYGIDFTKMVLTNPNKIGQEEFLKKYFWAWITYIAEEKDIENYMSRKLDKKNKLIYEPTEIQNLNTQINHPWIQYNDFTYSTDTLASVVNSYVLKETKGVGFVINVENFNKREEFVSAYFTFFDIDTREILWTTKVKGKPDGWGMTKFWAVGIIDATQNFFRIYQRKLRTYHS